MQFRTEISWEEKNVKIHPNSRLFTIGSCFADELAYIFKNAQMQVHSNPFGTMFNPYSIANSLMRICENKHYTEEDLVDYKGRILSLDHHTRFDSACAQTTLQKINEELTEANLFLQKTDFVLITLGTSFIYEFLPKNQKVANCHKIPRKFFEKKMLTETEIAQSLRKMINHLRDICLPNVQINFTISPVRHTKDGIVENQRSKSRLIATLHDEIEKESDTHYLPVYETMMDDLRDYRFYKEDMIHPTEQAIQYIFDNFLQTHCNTETIAYVKENLHIMKGIQHRPIDSSHPDYIVFIKQLKNRIKKQQEKVKHSIFEGVLQ